MIDYEQVVKAFDTYLTEYDCKNEAIALKIKHSYYTADLANKLARRLGLNEEQCLLAKTIGLLHDIGRFKQYEQKKMYDDYKTKINHAKLGLDYLFKEEHIKEFGIAEGYYEVLQKAIQNHNQFEVDKNLTEEEALFVHLIRDVDKIDIFRCAAGMDITFLEVSPKVKEAFFEHQLVNRVDEFSESDEVVMTLAFVFDIHFRESYELLKDTDNLELYLSSIEIPKGYEEEFDTYKKEVRAYLEERIEELC